MDWGLIDLLNFHQWINVSLLFYDMFEYGFYQMCDVKQEINGIHIKNFVLIE